MIRRSFVGYAAASAGAAALALVDSKSSTSGRTPADPHSRVETQEQPAETAAPAEQEFQLGAFSVSLAVKNLQNSKKFYEKLGFKSFAGDANKNWLILKNGDHVIGLFQGMLEKNVLTFNPGWDQNAKKLDQFTDVRELQRRLKAEGVSLMIEADEKTSGPASFMVVDPDGNQILFDQHV